MTHVLDDKIEALEADIRIKDQAITRLNRQALLAYLLPAYVHETRTILNDLAMQLARLFMECQTKGIIDYTDRITQRFEDLRGLTDGLARFARSFEHEHLVGLNDCVMGTTEVLQPLFHKSSTRLQTRMGEDGDAYRVPEEPMRQVLTNILLNALESVQETEQRDRLVIVETVFDKSFARIQVSDNGHGIKKDFIEKIWQPGFSTKRHRAGMGLPVTKLIVKSLGGYISVSGSEAEVTQFTVLIPRQQETDE